MLIKVHISHYHSMRRPPSPPSSGSGCFSSSFSIFSMISSSNSSVTSQLSTKTTALLFWQKISKVGDKTLALFLMRIFFNSYRSFSFSKKAGIFSITKILSHWASFVMSTGFCFSPLIFFSITFVIMISLMNSSMCSGKGRGK